MKVLKAKQQIILKELEALRGQLGDITERIQVKEAQLKNITGLLTLEDVAETSMDEGESIGQLVEANGASARRIPFLAAAAQLLEVSGKPMHYRKLADAMARESVYIPGRNPAANLLTHLSRDSRFRRVGRGTYGLQEWTVKSAISRKGLTVSSRH